jgi:uncharacterized protein (TIGR04255 family)
VHRRYPRPPIVEAVIDLKFDTALPERERERLRDRFKPKFPVVEEKKLVNITTGGSGILSTESKSGGVQIDGGERR